MDLVTDPAEVARLARKKEDENWKFRSFLKSCDTDDEELDRIVHRLVEQVAAQIDCTKCGNCCQALHPQVTDRDVSQLAKHLGMSTKQFREQYTELDDERQLSLRGSPCPFLADKKCSVYEARPSDCRSFPHLHKPDFRFRLFSVVKNCEVCPIVYNVYELLKEEPLD